jgi:hypothetical protein
VIISGCSEQDILNALKAAKKKYSDVTFKEYPKALNQRGDRFQVTIKMYSGTSFGARRAGTNYFGDEGRRTNSACYHVHGVFFDNLPEGTVIKSNPPFGSQREPLVNKAGDRPYRVLPMRFDDVEDLCACLM